MIGVRHRTVILTILIQFLDLEMTDKILVRPHTSSVTLIKWPRTIPLTATYAGKQIPSDTTCAPTTVRPGANDIRYGYPITDSVRACQTQGVTFM